MNLPNGHFLQNGKYGLTHVVGQGGFGITYKGVWFTEVKGPLGTVKTEVPVCIKEYFFKDYCYRDTDSYAVNVHSETGRTLFNKFKEKLIKEATILSEVHHPYIVNVLEVFEENGTAYIAMEYISGFSLKHLMEKEGLLPEAKVLKYVRQIGEALQFVHEKNILHLDIKPSNILIDKEDNARLIDFGVSKRYDIEQQETSTTMLTLSKGFASIEQYDSEGTQNFSPCPDIYSLGAAMYNLLTGKIPTESILRAARPLVNPSEINPQITPKTEAAILKAMQIIPADRFQTVREMMDALDLPPWEEKSPAPMPAKDTLPETDSEGDTTVVARPPAGTLPGEDDEQTIVNTPVTPGPSPVNPPKGRRMRHKSVWVAILLTILTLATSALAFLMHSNKSRSEMTDVIQLPEEGKETEGENINNPTDLSGDHSSVPSETGVDSAQTPARPSTETPEEEISSTEIPIPEGAGEKSKEETPSSAVSNAAETDQSASTQEPPVLRLPEEREVEAPIAETQTPSAAEIDAEYNRLVSSGKAYMQQEEYEKAKRDFTKAKEVKLTEEIVRLLIDCDEKAHEKKIADRKALYDEKMTFGAYKIVRKKATGRYGAIDAEANEHIPCKYISVGKAENEGRAFEREDNLFDIYNADGVLISKGATYY